jgi:hypothetical protein
MGIAAGLAAVNKEGWLRKEWSQGVQTASLSPNDNGLTAATFHLRMNL